MTGVDATGDRRGLDGDGPPAQERVDRVLAALLTAIRRFPLASLGILLWAGWALWLVHANDYSVGLEGVTARVFIACLALIGWDAGTRLLAERTGMAAGRRMALLSLGIGASITLSQLASQRTLAWKRP